MSTLNYWAHRLMPLHDPAPGYTPDGTKEVQPGKDVVFVACNRVGTERGKSGTGLAKMSYGV
jgi:protein N-terminal amidase